VFSHYWFVELLYTFGHLCFHGYIYVLSVFSYSIACLFILLIMVIMNFNICQIYTFSLKLVLLEFHLRNHSLSLNHDVIFYFFWKPLLSCHSHLCQYSHVELFLYMMWSDEVFVFSM
jgi:hypothetical protein